MKRPRKLILRVASLMVLTITASNTERLWSSNSVSESKPLKAALSPPLWPALTTDLALATLKGPRPQPVERTRDPFQFKSKRRREVRLMSPEQPGPVEPASRPRIPLKFIGQRTSNEIGRMAIISDNRDIFFARAGEIVAGRYRILRIGAGSLDLAYVDGGECQTLPFTGQ